MKFPWIAAVVLVVVVAVVAARLTSKTSGRRRGTPPERKRSPLTKNEQPMFFRLREAFPEHVVLAQVAFSALLTSKDRWTRNTFDRKVADFVVCSKGFEVLAVIELDDSSHRGKEEADAARDELLTGAGYRVLRFPRVPDVDALRMALNPPERRIEPTL